MTHDKWHIKNDSETPIYLDTCPIETLRETVYTCETLFILKFRHFTKEIKTNLFYSYES